MRRDLIAIVVTVEVYPPAWEEKYGRPYDAEDVLDYVKERVQELSADVGEAMSPDVRVRFRRQQ